MSEDRPTFGMRCPSCDFTVSGYVPERDREHVQKLLREHQATHAAQRPGEPQQETGDSR